MFKIQESILDMNLLESEMFKSLYVLADANSSVDNEIPLIGQTHNFSPTLIYATSHIDAPTDKILEQSYNNGQTVFVMNPWTLFELELL